MKRFSMLSGFAALMLAHGAFAIQEDQIRGEILSVDADQRNLEVQVTEVGNKLTADPGTTETYHVPSDVTIEYEIEAVPYRSPGVFDFADIRAGDRVLLDFDNIEDPSQVSRLRNEEPQDATLRARVLAAGEPIEESDTGMEEDMDMEDDMNFDEGNQFAANDRNENHALPASASALPMFALFGLVIAGFAFALRMSRS